MAQIERVKKSGRWVPAMLDFTLALKNAEANQTYNTPSLSTIYLLEKQLGWFLDFGAGPTQARLVDNRDWTQPMGVLEFLRDVGKHVTVNAMLAKESVRTRLERADGISFTEFSYMLLQANDFYVLHRDLGCELQVAGSDQWGNITAGIDLIRRRAGAAVHGLTSPLLVRADGQKFGKSAGGALWLDRAKTSPYQLYQYFLQVDDDDVEPMLARLTLLVQANERKARRAEFTPGRGFAPVYI